ncbi:MAG: hypothetical protein QM743_00755 [Chitinophagaceae bacterium]
MDSVLSRNAIPCGVSAAFFNGLRVSPGSPGSSAVVVPASFPSAAIDTCGKFCMYYQDVALSTHDGFDAGSGVGPNRRAIMCAVLNYIQSVIDCSAIRAGQYIRILVDTSFTSSCPVAYKTRYFAYAGPKTSVSSGVTNGYVHDFIVSGSDPAALTMDFHGVIRVNYDKIYIPRADTGYAPEPFVYYEGLTGISRCGIDFYSTCLHEMTHILGWMSYIDIFPSAAPPTVYSSIDTSLHATAFGTGFSTLTPGLAEEALYILLPATISG